jgi:3-methyladenine DNA glycosylase Mpg
LVLCLYQVARLGDNPRANLIRALEITQRLDREGKLNADQRRWITMISQELAKAPR